MFHSYFEKKKKNDKVLIFYIAYFSDFELSASL